MSFKFLYIDDATDKITQGLAQTLSSEDVLVEYKHVSIFDGLVTNNTIEIVSQYDGLILDLRLDNESYGGKNFPFTATEFAQHIRTLVTKGELKKDIPIIVFSTEANLKEIYFRDMTSNNLFDRFVTKRPIPINVSKKLFSLAQGYQTINTLKGDFAALLQTNIDLLDERIFSRFITGENIPTHEYAQVILKDLIYSKGVLINELYLASRLGIDIENSSDWEKIKDLFKDAKYTGIFSDGWDRWWMHIVDDIFEAISKTYLSYLNAKEKVDIFKKIGLENITFSEPIAHNDSYRYWVVCKIFKKPLDPMEGFKIYTRSEPKPWQEYEYVSLEALLHPHTLKEKNIKPHPSESENIKFAIIDSEKKT